MSEPRDETAQTIHLPACHLVDPRKSLNTCVGCGGSTLLDPPCQPARDVPLTRADAHEEDSAECDLCGKTACPDADLPEFSEPRDCALTPVYEELRYDRCDYGCGRDLTKATICRAARLLAEHVSSPGPTTAGDD